MALCAATLTTVSLAEPPSFSLNQNAPDILPTIDQTQLKAAAEHDRLTFFNGHQDTFVIKREMLSTISPSPGCKVVLID